MAKVNSVNNKSGDLTIDPGASGDSYVQFDINGTGEFRIGVDDDASDAFKISQGSALGSNDTLVVSAAGEITKPLQPAFLAVLNSNILNVTGDGSTYTVSWDTEAFDQNGDFSSTTFTAPVTGKYYFEYCLTLDDLTTSHNVSYVQLTTSNRTYLFSQGDPGNWYDSSGRLSLTGSVLTDMDASDTCYIRVTVSGSTKVVDITTNGSTDTYSWFSGSLQC